MVFAEESFSADTYGPVVTRACAMATASNRDMGRTPHAACQHTRRTGRTCHTCRTHRTYRTVARVVRVKPSHTSYVSNRHTRHTRRTVTRVACAERVTCCVPNTLHAINDATEFEPSQGVAQHFPVFYLAHTSQEAK